MLPRKAISRILVALTVLISGVAIGDVAFAAVITKPTVTTSEITVDGVTPLEPGVFQIVEPSSVTPFTLVGANWTGEVADSTNFQVRLREQGNWSQWYDLAHDSAHGADENSTEEVKSRGGTDPLFTGLSDGIEVRMKSLDGVVPTDFKISLIDSRVTLTDKMLASGVDVTPKAVNQGFFGSTAIQAANWPNQIVSASGATVDRPAIVTRTQWGADETKWVGPIRQGSTIKAGFIHHTVDTNNYTADQVPGMLRSMFIYFVTTRGYADLPYNFLIDKFGTLYEGRRGCAPGTEETCDGMAMPNQGAHTAGFNPNTFAVSAIGSYNLSSAADAKVLVEPIAKLFAWKFAPYGTDPLGTTSYTTAGTGTTARWPAETPVTIQTISGHKDVGITACPGEYLYKYIPAIRQRAADLSAISIRDVNVKPTLLSYTDSTPITASATIPANSQWVVDVRDPSGKVIQSQTGTQTTAGKVSYTWNKPAGLPPGKYSININARFTPPTPVVSPTPSPTTTVVESMSLSTSEVSYQATSLTTPTIQLAEKSTQVILASAPSSVQLMQFIRISSKATKVKWAPATNDLVNASEYSYRYSTNSGRSWSGWTGTKSTEAIISSWPKGKTYQVQVVARNFVGDSGAISNAYKAGATASMPKAPSIKTTRLSSSSTRISWTPSKSEKLPILTQQYRYSLNGKSWSAWTSTSDSSFNLTGLTAKKNYKVQVRLTNDVGAGKVASKSFVQKK